MELKSGHTISTALIFILFNCYVNYTSLETNIFVVTTIDCRIVSFFVAILGYEHVLIIFVL